MMGVVGGRIDRRRPPAGAAGAPALGLTAGLALVAALAVAAAVVAAAGGDRPAPTAAPKPASPPADGCPGTGPAGRPASLGFFGGFHCGGFDYG
jgi:hypothetical protein